MQNTKVPRFCNVGTAGFDAPLPVGVMSIVRRGISLVQLASLLRRTGDFAASIDAWNEAMTVGAQSRGKRVGYAPEDLMVQCAWTIEQLCRSSESRGTSQRRSEMMFLEVFRKLTEVQRDGDDNTLSPQALVEGTKAWITSPSMWLDRAQFHHGNKDFILAVSRSG